MTDPTRISDDQHNNATAVPQGAADGAQREIAAALALFPLDISSHTFRVSGVNSDKPLDADDDTQFFSKKKVMALLEKLYGHLTAAATPAPAPVVPQGEQATIAGLDAANGHLSIMLDDSVLMLKQLRQMVDDLHERWSNGGKPERGEFELLDRVDDWLSCRPVSMLSPPAPNVPQEPVMWQYRTWYAENTGTPGWSDWEELKPRNPYTDTVANRVAELQYYIANGYKYELRALCVATPSSSPIPCAEPVTLTDEEIQEVWNVASGSIPGWSRHIAYARAIISAIRAKGDK